MDFKAYLKRIKFSGTAEVNFDLLSNLQLSHLLSVPFENLSIHNNEPIILDYELLFNKIVLRRRGGFCYELNGLFASLLRHLGFNVAMLSAEVAREIGKFGPEFDHMTLMVLLEKRWLVDVGFGDSFVQPLLIDNRNIQQSGARSYQIDNHGNYYILKEKRNDSDWKVQYRFKLQPYNLEDFIEMCNYHQTSPESKFTQQRICSLAKPNGRITISDMHFIKTRDSKRQERLITNDKEFKKLLKEEFGIII